MKKIFLAFALAFACQVHAANYYVSDCQAGSVVGCVRGNDASAKPTSPNTPLRTVKKAFEIARNVAAGDKILFARGASFNVAEETGIQNFNASAVNPIIIGAYQPKWYTGTQKPILSATANITVIAFTDGASPEADGGYIVRDLTLKGNIKKGVVANGIFTSQLASDITLENLAIDGFRIGVYCGNNIPRVVLRNSKLTNNLAAGVLWGCEHSRIENNKFDNNGYGDVMLDHQIYLDSGPDVVADVTISGNTFTNSVHYKDGGTYDGTRCTGVVIVAHGRYDGVLVENNKLIETKAAHGGCWGMAFDSGKPLSEGGPEYFSNVTIRGNVLVNMGNLGIGCTSCDGWMIENNVLVWEGEIGDPTGIGVPSKQMSAWPEDLPITNVTVRNNSLYFKKPVGDPVGIQISQQGDNHIVSSNLIFFDTASPVQSTCFNTTNRGIADFADFSNNLCYRPSGVRFSYAYATQNAAQNADVRWNNDGQIIDPKTQKPSAANSYSMKPKAASPAINDANQTNCSPTQFGDKARPLPCDIGAYEYKAP